MARETKEERIVRIIAPALAEQLIELKNMAAAPATKESDLEVWCQAVLKSVLGFSASAGYSIRSQESRGKMRFDLVVGRTNKADDVLLLIEVKKLGSDLNKSDFRSGKTQLTEYLASLGTTRWGILTNGYEWRLYDFRSGAISVVGTDIRNDANELDTSPKGVQEAAWELLDLSSHAFENGTWEGLSSEAQALSPDSLARGMLSIDIVNKLRKFLNEEHGYRASIDSLTDKLAELITQGLNDLGSGWNDSKRAELDRYIRNQKRAAKRSKKRKENSSTPSSATAESVGSTPADDSESNGSSNPPAAA